MHSKARSLDVLFAFNTKGDAAVSARTTKGRSPFCACASSGVSGRTRLGAGIGGSRDVVEVGETLFTPILGQAYAIDKRAHADSASTANQLFVWAQVI